jgi:hypothetical protein
VKVARLLRDAKRRVRKKFAHGTAVTLAHCKLGAYGLALLACMRAQERSNHGVNDMAKKAKKKKAKKATRAVKARKAPAKKATAKSKAKKPAKKKAGKKKVVKALKKPAAKKKVAAKKPAPKAKAKMIGEGDYEASRMFLKDQAGFVKKNQARIPEMGKQAEMALDGPEGASLKAAEAEAASHSKAAE